MASSSIINSKLDNDEEQQQKQEQQQVNDNISKGNKDQKSKGIPAVSAAAVLVESTSLPSDTPQCRGHDFATQPRELDAILQSMLTTGFQATNLSLAIDQINQMRAWRLSDVPYNELTDDPSLASPEVRQRIRARIFLAFTSNQISSGQREIIRYLVQRKMVDVLITTAGGIEEDLIKCLQPTFIGDFSLKGKDLRQQGINRIGNLLVPNQNYCDFEDWVSPILHQMHDEQDQATQRYILQAAAVATATTTASTSENKQIFLGDLDEERFVWTPSKVIERLGNEINHPDSVLYWAGT
jgi:deoxyhypusine synthase